MEYYENTEGEEGLGTAVEVVFQAPETLDFERLILSMHADHAKVILVRHFGLRGKKAAIAAGLSSEWSLYRREHELKKELERKREHYFG